MQKKNELILIGSKYQRKGGIIFVKISIDFDYYFENISREKNKIYKRINKMFGVI